MSNAEEELRQLKTRFRLLEEQLLHWDQQRQHQPSNGAAGLPLPSAQAVGGVMNSRLQFHNGIQQQGNPTAVVQPQSLPLLSQRTQPGSAPPTVTVQVHNNLFDFQSSNEKQRSLLIAFAKNDQSQLENGAVAEEHDDSFLLGRAKDLLDGVDKLLAREVKNAMNEKISSSFWKHAPAFGALDINVSYRSGLFSDEMVKTWFSDQQELIKWARRSYRTMTPYEFLINKWLPLILSVYYPATKGFSLQHIEDLVQKCCLHLSGEMGANVVLAAAPNRRKKHSLQKYIKRFINSFKRTNELDMATHLSHIVGAVAARQLGHVIRIRYSLPQKVSVLLPPIQFNDENELPRKCSVVYLSLPMLHAGTTSDDVFRMMKGWTWSSEVCTPVPQAAVGRQSHGLPSSTTASDQHQVRSVGPSAGPGPVTVAPQDVFQQQLPPAHAQVVGPQSHGFGPVTVAPRDAVDFHQQVDDLLSNNDDWEKFLYENEVIPNTTATMGAPVPINVTEANDEDAKERRQKRDELQRRKDAEAEKKKKSNNNTSTEKSKEQEQEQEQENNGKKGVEEEQKGTKRQELVSETCNKYLLVVRYETDPLFTNS